jgi:hypothetical protein
MERFKILSPDAQDLVLRLGLTCYDGASNLQKHDIEKDYETRIQDLETRLRNNENGHSERVQSLQSEFNNEKRRLKIDYDTRSRELEDQHNIILKKMRDEQETIVQDRIKTAISAVHNERTLINETLQNERKSETEENQRSFHLLCDELQKTIREAKEATDTLKGSSTNSAIRGKVGESTAEAMLDQIFPGCTWENTSGTGGKGDFHVIIPGIGKVILDIKNHEKDRGGVPLRDRKKLERDLDSDTSAIGAILVATQANIQSGNHCQVIYTEQEKPVVCCLMWGDWFRMREAAEVLRVISRFSKEQDHTEDDRSITRTDFIINCKNAIESLNKTGITIKQSYYDHLKSVAELHVMLSMIDPHWQPTLREWLMVNLVPTKTTLIKSQRLTLSSLKNVPGIPKEAKGKTGSDKLRDELVSLGITINADKSIPNYILKNYSSQSGED